MESKLWCPIPWSHVAVKSNGSLRICSHSQSGGNKNTLLEKDGRILRIEDLKDQDVLNCDTLREVRKQFINNQWPDQCRRCKLEQESGKRSRNQWESTMYDFSREDAEKITLEDGAVLENRILSLDLRLGNKCNLQCVMCYPGESNQWYKIQERITGSKVFMIDNETYDVDNHQHFTWSDDEKYYDLIADFAPYVEKIKFGGGEPFISKKHVTLLNRLIESNHSHNVELEYSINVTILPEYIFEIFPKFKEVKLCASVDGIEDCNEAIRYPTEWKTVEKNLEILDNTPDNITVFTSTTISILNLEHFVTWMKWLESRNFKKINKKTYAGIVSHPVMNPKYLNLRLLSSDQHSRMFEYLKDQTDDPVMIKKLDQWEIYSKKLPISEEEIIQGRKDLKQFISKMQKIQNKDWSKIFPICSKMVEEWKE